MNNRKRFLLKGIHIIFSGIFLGSVLCMSVLLLFNRSNTMDEMFATYQAINLLDAVVAFSAMLTLISGLLITWLTNWSFKHLWIKVKLFGTIITILYGILITGRLKHKVLAILVSGRYTALQNSDFLTLRQELMYYTPIVVPLLIILMFVSTYKPLGKRTKGE